jgi:hypothetical protein
MFVARLDTKFGHEILVEASVFTAPKINPHAKAQSRKASSWHSGVPALAALREIFVIEGERSSWRLLLRK